MKTNYEVILAVKNGERYLKRALDSIYSQTIKADQIILVNDASSDETVKIAKSYGVSVFDNLGSGQAAALNLGISKCNAPFISFLDHDDYWDNQKQEKQLEKFALDADLDFVTCEVMNFSLDGRSKNMSWSRVFGACTFRKEFLNNIGGLDVSFKHHAIVEWWGRSNAKSAHFSIVEEPLLFRLLHEANSTAIEPNEARSNLIAAIRRNRKEV